MKREGFTTEHFTVKCFRLPRCKMVCCVSGISKHFCVLMLPHLTRVLLRHHKQQGTLDSMEISTYKFLSQGLRQGKLANFLLTE